MQQTRRLFEHLVGAGEEGLRYRDAHSLRGLVIDHQFELRGLLSAVSLPVFFRASSRKDSTPELRHESIALRD
jgi:hypothetical protein